MNPVDHDPGLGNERTTLAWQRTALSVVAGAAIVGRLTLEGIGVVTVLATGVAAVIGLLLFVEGRDRYRRNAGARHGPPPPDARSTLALSIAVAILAGTELSALMLG